jgi:aminoglycoside phosphotransferase (APT) family kinase protein
MTDGIPKLVPVLPNHRFDEARLKSWLEATFGERAEPFAVRQFQGGQSNPTFHIQFGPRQFVLRKKPPGPLLPSAHAVDREYRVIKALSGTSIPVPHVHLLCTDESVIGQIFYLMDYIPGRVYADRALPGLGPADRAAMYDDMNRVLAALHRLDPAALGLADYGKPEAYVARQIRRWTQQYQAAPPEPSPEMDALIAWLGSHTPPADETALVHGDFRLGNLLFDPAAPRILAVLDWELSTLGHPLADLAYNILTYYLPEAAGGFGALDPTTLGIPAERDYVARYAERAGRAEVGGLTYMIVFSMFRLAAILAGVYARALQGNAADAGALERGKLFREVARRALDVAESAPAYP